MLRGFFVMSNRSKFKELTSAYMTRASNQAASIGIATEAVRTNFLLLIYMGTTFQETHVKRHLDALMDEIIEKCKYATIEYRSDVLKDLGRFYVLEYFTNKELCRLQSTMTAVSYCSRMNYKIKKMKDCFIQPEDL